MKKIFIIQATFCCLYSFCFGQGVINNYPFGHDNWPKALLNFPNNVPSVSVDTNITLRMRYTHANISDSNGILLFYTNGIKVMDGNHYTMPNGAGLNPCQYTTQVQYDGLSLPQADIIIPFPDDSNKFYLFHQSMEYLSVYSASQTYYSVIDMTKNNGMGDVTLKNISFLQDTLYGGSITACKHANGRDWWLIIPRAYSPMYYIYLITPIGVNFNSLQSIGNRYYDGQAAFSKDGSKYGYYDYYDDVEIFDFDRCSGLLSNNKYVAINDSNWGLGFCFSPDSKLAYAASAHFLYQFNLDSANLSSSMQTVANWDSTYDPWGPPVEAGFEFMQIGPDGKIYMTTTWATHYMHYIDYPDSIGVACGMQQHALLLPTYNGNTIPNFVNYFLGPVVGSVCDSLGLGVSEYALHDFKFSIHPNPITDKTLSCKYVLPQNKPGTLEVLDLTGRILIREPLPEWSTEQHIKLRLSAGLYEVKITSNRQQSVQKMIIP